jgi:hypothetical protein
VLCATQLAAGAAAAEECQNRLAAEKAALDEQLQQATASGAALEAKVRATLPVLHSNYLWPLKSPRATVACCGQ